MKLYYWGEDAKFLRFLVRNGKSIYPKLHSIVEPDSVLCQRNITLYAISLSESSRVLENL